MSHKLTKRDTPEEQELSQKQELDLIPLRTTRLRNKKLFNMEG